jgi:hypothetical protein
MKLGGATPACMGDMRNAYRIFVGKRGLRLAQPGGPTDRLSVLFTPFYLKTEAESSFRNVVVL